MTHGRKPRRLRPMAVNTFDMAINAAGKLTKRELDGVMAPTLAAHKALREGVATELQWQVLASAMTVALRIEQSGIVRGLREHMVAAQTALQGIERRAMASGAWRPTALYYGELDDIGTAINLHRYQLSQLSAGELREIYRQALADVRCSGGRVVHINDLEPQAA
jgi:hypothetical protein